MMGASKYVTRTELLRQKATGIIPEVSPEKQRLYDRGHAAEEASRTYIEEMVGDDLYPVVGTSDDGYLSASFDGLTMTEDLGYEHKLWSENLAAQVRARELEPHYYWQLEQQCLVAGLDNIIFVCSDGTAEKREDMVYQTVPGRAEQLLAGWRQFDADLASYQPPEIIPAAVAAPVEGFGALVLNVEGKVLACNLDDFKAGAQAFIDRLPKSTDLVTDQDFVDAAAAVKACEEAESRIKAQKAAAMAQLGSIDEVFRSVDQIAEVIKTARLSLDKVCKAEKENRRNAIIQGGTKALSEHIDKLNQRLGGKYILGIVSDFNTACKGLKTITSIQNATDTELARCKIASNELADRIEINHKVMINLCDPILFPDFAQVCTKSEEDFANLVAMRVSQHKESEERKEAARKEVEAKSQATQPAIQPVQAQAQPMAVVAPIDDGKRMKLGDINALLSPLSITSDGLAKLGFHSVGKEKSAVLYKAMDFGPICSVIMAHVAKSCRDFISERKAA